MTELWKESVFLICVLDFTEALALDQQRKSSGARKCCDEHPHTAHAISISAERVPQRIVPSIFPAIHGYS